jgi:hypothetical protein
MELWKLGADKVQNLQNRNGEFVLLEKAVTKKKPSFSCKPSYSSSF